MTTLPFPHSRILDRRDFADYPEALRDVVGQCFDLRREQNPARKVEYVSALGAIQQHWQDGIALTAVDVGGDGSPFDYMLQRTIGLKPTVVDPAGGGKTLHDYLGDAPRLAHILTCLSVLEHVPMKELPQFLDDLYALLAPGGILYLTADCALNVVGEPTDTYHFHWMRERIFSIDSWTRDIIAPLVAKGLWLVDVLAYDQQVIEPWVYDYAFISVALTKPRRRIR